MTKNTSVTSTLRDVTEADLPILFEQQLDPQATQMAAFPSRERDAFMAHWGRIMVNENDHELLDLEEHVHPEDVLKEMERIQRHVNQPKK